MAINYWRYVESDYDGHRINECLHCYGRFGGNADGWSYCPLCGTKWIGEKRETEEQADLRRRIEATQWDRPTKPVALWVIEKREWSQWGAEPVKWSQWQCWQRLHTKAAKEALMELRHWQRVYAEENEPEPEGSRFRYGTEYRLRLVTV